MINRNQSKYITAYRTQNIHRLHLACIAAHVHFQNTTLQEIIKAKTTFSFKLAKAVNCFLNESETYQFSKGLHWIKWTNRVDEKKGGQINEWKQVVEGDLFCLWRRRDQNEKEIGQLYQRFSYHFYIIEPMTMSPLLYCHFKVSTTFSSFWVI